MNTSCAAGPAGPITASLDNEQIWKKFNRFTTEMIITRTGRRMFPRLEYSVSGLLPDEHYALALRFEIVDENRYQFSSGEWEGKPHTDQQYCCRDVIHLDGVLTGQMWMDRNRKIIFDQLKLSNNTSNTAPSGHTIIMPSLRKYIPVLSVYKVPQGAHLYLHKMSPQLEFCQLVASVRLDYTSFITVTAYQNMKITQLKIEHNPYARGFRHRESGRRTASPQSTSSSDCSQNDSLNGSPSQDHQAMMHNMNMPFPMYSPEMSANWLNYYYQQFNPMWYGAGMPQMNTMSQLQMIPDYSNTLPAIASRVHNVSCMSENIHNC